MASSLWGLRQTEDEQEMARKAAAEMAAAALTDPALPAAGEQKGEVEQPVETAEMPDPEGEVEVDVDDGPEVTGDIPDPEEETIGIGEHARDVIRQETGKRADENLHGGDDLYTRIADMFGISREGSAAALIHVAPFARQLTKMSANIEERNLGKLLDGNYSDEEIDEIVSASGDVLRNSDEEIKRLVQTDPNPTVARRKLLQLAAEDELRERAKTRQGAEADLANKKQTTWGKIAGGTLENAGYVNSFIYGSTMAGGLGLGITVSPGASALGKIAVEAANTVIGSAPASVAGAAERATRMMKKDYAVDADGELQVIDNNYGEMRSLLQGGAGGFVENTVVEGGTDIAIDLACLGLSKIPGAQAFIVQPLKRMSNAAVKKMMGNAAGRALIRVGKGYNAISQFTQFDSQPVEMLEENIQPIWDNVFGLDKKRGEYRGVGEEATEYAKQQFNWETQKDIFYGLIGTCLIQAGAGGITNKMQKRAPGATTAKEAASVLTDYANVPKEKVATLTDEEKIQLADAYRTMSDNPDKLIEFAQQLGAKSEAIMDGIVNREGARMNERMRSVGLLPTTFSIPLKDENGKKVPDFKKTVGIDGITGKTVERMAVVDPDCGVTIYDNGVGAGSERAYTVENPHTQQTVDVPNLALARKTASLFKNDVALMAKDRENKAKYIHNVWQSKYDNVPVELCQTMEQAVEFSKRRGVDVTQEEGFTPDRPAWHLNDGTIVMVSDNISSPYEVDTLFQHEIIGHNNEAMRDEFMANLDSKAVSEAQQVLGLTDEQMSDPRTQREVFANVIQQRRHNPSVMQKIKHFINEKRRAAGEKTPISDADLEVFARKWEDAAKGNAGNLNIEPAPDVARTEAEPEVAEVTEEEEEVAEVEGEIPDTEAIEPAATKEEEKKPITEQNIIEKMTNETPTEEVSIEDGDPDAVVYDETLKPNFKGGANPETGEVNPLMGKPFDLVSNPILVYEFAKPRIGKNGKPVKRVVGTGVHRYQLYRRAGRKTIPARILREADGYTLEDVMKIDAVGNIIDGQGSIRDYVKFFDDMKTSRKEAEEGGYLSRTKGETAFSIHEGATDDTKAAVDWEGSGSDGMISTEQAGIISEAAPKDAHPRNKALQRILVTKALNGLRGKKLAIVARSLAEEVKTAKTGGGAGGEMQLDLFSSAEDLELLAMEDKRAEYRVGKANEYNRIAENLRTAMSKGGKLDLNAEYAKELGITDPKDKKQLATARDKAVERANYWENAIRLNAEDKAAMDAKIGASAKKADGKKSEIADKLKAIKQSKTGKKSASDKKDAEKSTQTEAKPAPEAVKPEKPAEKPVKIPDKSLVKERQKLADAASSVLGIPIIGFGKNGEVEYDSTKAAEVAISRKSAENSVEKITEAIPVDARDGLIDIHPDERYGDGAYVVYYAPGGKEEFDAAVAGIREEFSEFDVRTPIDGQQIVLIPKKAAQKAATASVEPSVRMKDEESEKKAEAQEDALAALFGTSELNPKGEVGENERKYLKWASKWHLNPESEKTVREFKRKNSSAYFGSSEFDPKKFQARVGAVAELAKTYVDSGVGEFKTLATRMAARFPDKFGNMKPYLRAVWNAVAEQMDLEEVTKKEAEAIYAEAEKAYNTQSKEGETNGLREPGRPDQAGGEASPGVSSEGGAGAAEGRNAVSGDAGAGENASAGTVAGGGHASGQGLSVQRPEMGERPVHGGGAEEVGEGAAGGASVAGHSGRRDDAAGEGPERGESGAQLEPVEPRDVGGRGSEATAVATAQAQVEKDLPNTVKNENYIITDADERAIEGDSPRKKFKTNVEAIRIVRKLAEDGRAATPEERETLARYVGWGGLKDAFNPNYVKGYEEEQTNGTITTQRLALIRKSPLGEEGFNLYKEMRQLLTEKEINSAEQSTASSFFTPIRLCRAVHKALAKSGLKGGRFLETSAGIGNLIGTGNYTGARWTAVEYDEVSGQILKALYPKANVRIQGFEDVQVPNDFYDAAVSNVPFGTSHPFDADYKKYGFVIHDFFFAKAVDKVHPGGVIALITSTGTLDKRDKKLIRYLNEHGGQIVGAVRMPNGFFKKNAGTDVATDIIFIQKVDGKADNSAFIETVKVKGCDVAKYFVDHPEMCIGEMVPGTNQFGEPAMSYKAGKTTFEDIENAVAKAGESLAFKSVVETQKPSQIVDMVDSNGLANGNVGVVGNKIVRKINGELVEVPKEEIKGLTKKLIDKGVTPQKIVSAISSLRNAHRAVIDGQLADCSDDELKRLQGDLNREYDTFVRRYGHLHDKAIENFVKLDYSAAPLMMEMESDVRIPDGVDKKGSKRYKHIYKKADVFTKRTIFSKPKVTHADSVLDGLRISLNETGSVDTARIAELTGKPEEEVRKELMDSGRVFVNPETSGLETRDEYLSGSVRRKLKAARAAAEVDESFKRNVDELEKVQPEDIAATDISYQIGQNWIPQDIYEQFYKEVVFQGTAARLRVSFDPREHLWHVDNARGQTEWDEERGLAIEDLLERTMNGQSIVVRRKVGEKEYVIDQQATTATKIVQEKIAKAFQSWMTDDIDRANRLERLYNDLMNDNVQRKFDTDVLELNGISERWKNNVSTPGREYQKRCIARGAFGGNLLIAHCVGAGKTFEMASICMQLRKLGIARKPMFAVPNHMLEQWNREFHEAYPGAKILVADKKDLSKNNRRAFLARAANGDWDCVIVAHSSFSRIAMSPEHQAEYIESELAELRDVLANAESKKDQERIKKKIQSLNDKLKSLLDPSKKDDAIKFEEMGCDYLFIDEAHNFKGLQINTHMSNVPGVTGSVSQRAQDLEMKCRYIAKLHGSDKGVVFATGTPISNSISEMYVMMRYLAPTKMDDMGVRSFDDWAKQFGQVVNEWSPNPSGVGFREKARFSQFQNVPEMKNFFRSFSDIVLDGDLKIRRPKPKEIKHVLKPSAATKAYVLSLNERMERMQSSKVDPREDNMLKVTTEGRLLAIDPALIGVKDDTHTRANACADEVKRVYDASTGKWAKDSDGKDVQINGTQLIFCDSGVPKKKQFKELVRDSSGNYQLASGYWNFTVTAPDAYGARQAFGQRVDGRTITFSGISDHSIGGMEDLASVYSALEGLAMKANAVNAESKLGKGTKKAKKPEGESVDINGWLDMNSDSIGYDPRFSSPFVQPELSEAAPETEEEQEAADDKDTSDEANGDVEVDNMLRGKFNMYAELRKQLIRRGIPAEEIAFIHDAETMTQKQALFDKVKKGQIRVLIGNTAKMGEGTNVQDALCAIHHLDIPWKPAWITQRDGRGIRSGNMNEEVEIHKYITEGTFDVYSWDTVGRKAKFIENAMNARMDQRVIEDVDSTVMSLEEGKAAAAGDPRILERVKLIKAVEKKQMEFDTQVKASDRAKLKLRVAENELMEAEKKTARYTDAIKRYNEAKGENPFTYTAIGDTTTDLTDNTEIARAIQDRLAFFARKGASDGIVGKVFGFDLRYSREKTDAKIEIREIGVEMPVTILPGTGAAFPPTDLSKLKTQITNHTSERALHGFDDYLTGYRRRVDVARKGVENSKGFDRDAASSEIGEMYLTLAKLNKALGIKDASVRDIALAHAQEKGLADEIKALEDKKAGETEEEQEPGAEFATGELDPKKFGIITDIRSTEDAEAVRKIAKDVANGKLHVKPYSAEEFARGIRFGGDHLGAIALICRQCANQDRLGRNRPGSYPQREQVEGYARHSGIFVADLGGFLAPMAKIGSGGTSVAYTVDYKDVYKVRPLKYADVGLEYGGATLDVDDVLLSNAVFGDQFKCEIAAVGRTPSGEIALVLKQPFVNTPRTREMQPVLDSYMGDLGFEKVSNEEYTNGRIKAVDMRIGDNIGVSDGEVFVVDPMVSFTADYLRSQGTLFSTGELDPKRNGIAKRDIENQARRLGRTPFRPKPKTWPEVYQRSEAMLNQTGFVEKLVEDAAKYARPLTAEQTLAVGEYQLALGQQYAEIRELRKETESDLENADPSDTEYIKEVSASLRSVKEEESKIAARYATCFKAFRMSKAEQGRALAANRAQFSDEFDFLGMKEARQAALGRDLTPEEMKNLHDICDRARDLDEEGRAELWAAVQAQAEKTIKDLFFKDGVKRSGTSRGGRLTDYRKKYLDAMKHLEIYRDTVGGSLIGITGDEYGTWNKPIFDLLLYHRFVNPDITASEALKAVTEDVNTYIEADEQTVARILTGFERSWDINRHDDVLKGGRDLRSQILTQLQIEKLLNKEMPGKTGPIQADPSEDLRNLRHTRDVLKNDLAEETGDPRKLQSRQKRWMKWYDNRIEDLKREIAAGERLPQSKKTLEWTDEMRAKRAEYEALVEERDRVCGPKLSEEERVKLYEKSLEKTLRRAIEKLQRAKNDDFRRPDRRETPTNDYIESLKKAIEETNKEWRKEKKDRLNYGRTAEELRKFNDARERTRTKRVQYWQALTAPNANRAPVKHPPIPMPPEQQARYDELGRQMKKLRRQVLDMRAHDELLKKPWAVRNGIEYRRFVNGITRGFLATADHSAVLRQMAQLSQAHPLIAAQVFKNTIGTAFSDEKAQKINAEYLSDPRIREAVDKGWLNWRNLEADGGSNDVEMFSTLHTSAITIGRNPDGTEKRLALDDIKGVGAVLRGSERIYASYINALSAEIYLALTNADNFTAKLLFGQSGLTDFTKKEIAARINMANGSAQIDAPRKKQFMNQLTGIFWAPKLALSRAQLAVGWDIWHPLFTKEADVKTRLRTAAFNAIEHGRAKVAMIALGTLMLMLSGDGDDKEKWRRASLFQKFIQSIKPRVGATTLDFSGGEAGWYQLMAKWATLEKETGTGKTQYLAAKDGHKKSFGANVMTDTFRFAQGKFNPLLSNSIALWTGEDYTGQPFGLGKLAVNTFIPLGASDITSAFVENGLGRGLLLSPFIVFGAGGNTYPIKRYDVAVNQFTEAAKEYDKIRENRDIDEDEKGELLQELEDGVPELKNRGRIEGKISTVKYFEKQIRALEKLGVKSIPKSLTEGLEKAKNEALELIRQSR